MCCTVLCRILPRLVTLLLCSLSTLPCLIVCGFIILNVIAVIFTRLYSAVGGLYLFLQAGEDTCVYAMDPGRVLHVNGTSSSCTDEVSWGTALRIRCVLCTLCNYRMPKKLYQ